MVIFPAEGEPSNSIQTPQQIARQGCWIPPQNIRLSANLTVDAANLITSLKLQNSRIGIDSFRFWPVFEYQTFMNLCPETQLVE